MSYVFVSADSVASAVADLNGIGSTIRTPTAAAAAPTTTVLAAARDKVSIAIATLFGTHAQEYQAISTRAAVFIPNSSRH
jgi:hypothetical protein